MSGERLKHHLHVEQWRYLNFLRLKKMPKTTRVQSWKIHRSCILPLLVPHDCKTWWCWALQMKRFNCEYWNSIYTEMSKNVLEERESPDQISISSMDFNFCVIFALTLHLEHIVILNYQDSNPILFSMSKRRTHALF